MRKFFILMMYEVYNYTFESEPLSFYNSTILLKDLILGNKIIVTSYNYFNHWVITEAELKAAVIEEARPLIFNNCAIIIHCVEKYSL